MAGRIYVIEDKKGAPLSRENNPQPQRGEDVCTGERGARS